MNSERAAFVRMRLFVRLNEIAVRLLQYGREPESYALSKFIGAHEYRVYGSGSCMDSTEVDARYGR